MLSPDLKKGSAEFLVLSLLEHDRRHGYELNKLIESRSDGVLTFHIGSLYPLLYRMERRGWIAGRWVEKPGERRRRFYSLTPAGRRALDDLRDGWLEFMTAVARVTGLRYG
jgi:PadR family transcriptional regulator, regulatory protein PadR